MAYTFFPTSSTEISQTLKNVETIRLNEIITLYGYLNGKFPKNTTPINIDPDKLSSVNISRGLQGDIDIPTIKREAGLIKTSIKFGNGSAGGRGVNNKGNLFEGTFAENIRQWWNGETIADVKIFDAIEDIANTYGLKKLKELKVEELNVQEVGELNNRRPLIFSPKILISSKIPVHDNDLGEILSDITLKSGNKNVAYLSLKLGNTVTFFNSGVKTVLIPQEIKNGDIKNVNGLKLLNMFNIKPALFCDVFNGKIKKSYSENVWKTMTQSQKSALKDFLISGIGHGYHVIHKFPSKIKSTQIDKKYMIDSATPSSCVIYYGGKTGTGKRIDMEIETKKYFLKLNIRDSQGRDGYPSRIMADFTYK
jgi:hypothetical protein